jgi:ankyrin repeat protein
MGRTALHFAAKEGYAKVCAILLEKGADLESKDKVWKHDARWQIQ